MSPSNPGNNNPTGSAIYPVISRVINESPSSFISPAASPQLNELSVTPGASSALILAQYPGQPQPPFLVQPAVMSPSNFKSVYMMPFQALNDPATLLASQQGPMPQYWQISQSPKLPNYYGNPAPILSPQSQSLGKQQNSLSPMSTAESDGTKV